jgi:hypothetical protein
MSTFLRVSERGRATIKQAIEKRGWTVKEEDSRPLKEASKFLVQQQAVTNQWHANDPRWLKDFELLFRVEQDQDINKIKTIIAKSKQGSLVARIEQLIEAGDVFAKDISYGTWSRFASQKKSHRINIRAIQAYCYSLGLNWQEIVDRNETQTVEESTAQVNTALPTPTTPVLETPPPSSSARSHPYHNLPVRYHTAWIGRDKELTKLLELFRDRTRRYISVEGIGGAGKTSLVLEAAYRCLEANPETSDRAIFDAIVFTSAKQKQLIGNYILQRPWQERTLNDIFRAILRTLERPNFIATDVQQQLECIRSCLETLRTLLIVDNLETLEDQKTVLAFLYELPRTVKVVITTREREAFGTSIHLEGLPLDEAMCLIEHHAEEQSVQLKPEQFQTIYQRTSGLPLGIVYAIGQLSVYGVSTDVLATRLQPKSDLAQYCFEDSVQRLRGQLAHRLLMGLALFAKSASRDAITEITLPKANCLNALAQLHQLRLVMQREERYDMHPLTREYARAELEAYPEFEQQARERWVNWYLTFSQPYEQDNWRQWYDYKDLEQEWENLHAVVDWCIHQNRYEQVKTFWRHVKGYTYVHGYWHERLAWIDWLLQVAQQHQDKSMMAEALSDKGWTLTLMRKPEQLAEVDALFEQVSHLHQGEDPLLQLELTIEGAVWSIHQRKFDRTRQRLERGKTLLRQVPIEEPKRVYQEIRIDYYEAEVWFRTGYYPQAKLLYQKALAKAQAIQWQQVEVYILNWLADVELAGGGNLEEAERLLKMGMPIALARNDKRSITFYKRSQAHLEKLRGNLAQFRRWTTEAKDGFESLGMLAEVQEMQSWLEA